MQLLWKAVWQFFKKLNKELPYDPAISLLSIEVKAETLTYICTPMFIAALFTTAKKWKQPVGPSTGEWT